MTTPPPRPDDATPTHPFVADQLPGKRLHFADGHVEVSAEVPRRGPDAMVVQEGAIFRRRHALGDVCVDCRESGEGGARDRGANRGGAQVEAIGGS